MGTPIDAAALILVRDDGRLLLGVRSMALRFLGGYASFAGGRLDPEDEAHAARLFGATDLDARLRACALRELYEEMALVITERGATRAPPGVAFEQAFVPLPATRLEHAGRWITPDYSPIRFDTRFYVLRVPMGDAPLGADGEMQEALWIQPRAALEQYHAQRLLLPPPTKWALQAFDAGPSRVIERLRSHPCANGAEHLGFQPLPDIRQLPLRTPTLPPATHTNTYVIGHEQLLVVDPATYEADERDKLLTLLEDRTDRGAKVKGILLTHHHLDHVGAAEWLSEKTGAPIIAHAATRDLLAGRVRVDEFVDEGDLVDLGPDSTGTPFRWRVLFTPGHAPGHVVLRDLRPTGRALVVGDMVAAVGSIIIDPPEGHMADYLDSLRRLRRLPQSVLLSAHGPPIVDGHAKLDEYIAHRLDREAKVFSALVHFESAKPEDLLPSAYADTPSRLYPFAARACLAHLEKLVGDGRARRSGDRFVAETEHKPPRT